MRLPFRRRAVPPDRPGGGEPPDPRPFRRRRQAGSWRGSDDHARSCPARAEQAARLQPLRDQVPGADVAAVPALRARARRPARPSTVTARRRLRRVERLLRHPRAAVLLGEDRGPAVPAQAADPPLRRPVRRRRRHHRLRRDQAAGQPGHPEAPGRAAVPAGPRACATAGSMVEHDPAQRAFLEEVLGPGLRAGPAAGRDDRLPARGLRRPRRRRSACGSPSTTGSAAATATSTSAPTPRTGSSCRPGCRSWRSRPTSGCRTGSPTSPPQPNMSVVRISKYCQSVEAFGRAPRSVFHVPTTIPADATVTLPKRGLTHALRRPGPVRHVQRRRHRHRAVAVVRAQRR